MKRIFILFFLIAQALSAQIDQQKYWDFQDAMARDASPEITANGSPYIQEKFELLKLNKFDGKVFSGRFNAYNGEMQVQTKDKIIALDVSDDYEVTFVNSNKIYRTSNYVDENGNQKRGFLVLVSQNDDYTLYKEEKIEFKEKVEPKTSYDKGKPAEFDRMDDNFYVSFGDTIKYIPTRKNDLIKHFSEHEKKVKSFVKDNKLNPKNEDELIKIVAYLSTLK